MLNQNCFYSTTSTAPTSCTMLPQIISMQLCNPLRFSLSADYFTDATSILNFIALVFMQNLGQYLELASALYNSVLELELPYRRAFEAGDSMKYLFYFHYFF